MQTLNVKSMPLIFWCETTSVQFYLSYHFLPKVIDFGCSEGKLISKQKRVECIEELVGIDIDEDTLEFNQIKAKPFAADYLDPRANPLTVSFYQGILLLNEYFNVCLLNKL